MAEYIEIGQLWKCETCYHRGPHGCVLGGFGCDHGESYRPDYRKLLEKADVAPVVHGRWEEADDGDGAVCSVCREDFCNIYLEVDRFNYCPNCGAHMKDGE